MLLYKFNALYVKGIFPSINIWERVSSNSAIELLDWIKRAAGCYWYRILRFFTLPAFQGDTGNYCSLLWRFQTRLSRVWLTTLPKLHRQDSFRSETGQGPD